MKRLPFPSRDSAVTRPPWALAMPCTIAKPRPISVGLPVGVEGSSEGHPQECPRPYSQPGARV